MKVNLSDRIRPNSESALWVFEEVKQMEARIKRLEDCIEGAWCLIANVSQGDWKLQHLHWQESVAQWMEKEMYPIYKEISKRKAKEVKP